MVYDDSGEFELLESNSVLPHSLPLFTCATRVLPGPGLPDEPSFLRSVCSVGCYFLLTRSYVSTLSRVLRTTYCSLYVLTQCTGTTRFRSSYVTMLRFPLWELLCFLSSSSSAMLRRNTLVHAPGVVDLSLRGRHESQNRQISRPFVFGPVFYFPLP